MSNDDARPIVWAEADDGLVTLELDDPSSKVNTITTAFVEALALHVTRLEHVQDDIPGVVIRSRKASFLAGGDLNRLLAVDGTQLEQFVDDIDLRKSYTRRLELLRCPVVAIVHGAVLGGGLELAMSCHRSIGIDDGRAVVGLPEATLGLIPGAGGIVRTVDRLGIDRALDDVIIPGRRFSLADAVEFGLIDDSAESVEAAEAAAREWMVANSENPQRAIARPPSLARELPPRRAAPATRAITAVANAVLAQDFDQALHVESVHFGSVVVSEATKNGIRTSFFGTNDLRKAARGLATEAAASVHLEPVSVSARAAMSDWTTRGPLMLSDTGGPGGAGHPLRPDARIMLESLPRDAWPLLWLVGDPVGDGQQVVEYLCDRSEDAYAALVTLARSGILPVPADPTLGSLSQRMRDALEAAIDALLAQGTDPGRISAALHWAGLPGATQDPGSAGDLSEGELDLVCALLDAMAHPATSVSSGAPDLVDAVSVRVGGFPGWTGGARTWQRDGRKLAQRLANSDAVPATGGP